MRALRLLDMMCGPENERGGHGFTAAAWDEGHEVVSVDIIPEFNPTICGDILDDRILGQVLMAGPFDMIFAGTPCQGFSNAAVRHSHECRARCSTCGAEVLRVPGEKWAHLGAGWPDHECKSAVPGSLTYRPKSDTARLGWKLAERCRQLIAMADPAYYLIENPLALLRQLPMVAGLPRVTIDQCQYGNSAKKPTDLFGNLPPSFVPRPRCIAKHDLIVDAQGAPLAPANPEAPKKKWVYDQTPYRPNPDGTICHEAGYRGSPWGTQGKANAAERGVIPYELSLDLLLALEQDCAESERLSA